MGLDGMVNPERKHAGPVEGTIRSEPSTEDDPVYVNVLGEDDRNHVEGPCAWAPRGDLIPTEGNICAITWTDAGTALVVMWWPGEEWPDD